jgi:hypothetical protein
MRLVNFFLFLLMVMTLGGCEVIGDIFSAGFYTAMILMVILAIIIVFVVTRVRKK